MSYSKATIDIQSCVAICLEQCRHRSVRGILRLSNNQDVLMGVVVHMARIALEARVGTRMPNKGIHLSSNLVGCGPASEKNLLFTCTLEISIFGTNEQ